LAPLFEFWWRFEQNMHHNAVLHSLSFSLVSFSPQPNKRGFSNGVATLPQICLLQGTFCFKASVTPVPAPPYQMYYCYKATCMRNVTPAAQPFWIHCNAVFHTEHRRGHMYVLTAYADCICLGPVRAKLMLPLYQSKNKRLAGHLTASCGCPCLGCTFLR